MKKLKHIILISILSIFVITNIALSADFSSQDSFSKGMSNFKDFSDGVEHNDSLKQEVKQQKQKLKDKESTTTNGNQSKQIKIKKKKEQTKSNAENVTELDIKSEVLDYYPERQEIEAVGHASIVIPSDHSTLRADKLVLNQATGILKGYGNIYLIKGPNVMEGDFITIDLNEDNALLTNPITENVYVKINAEDAQLISGKDILLENGIALPKIDKTVPLGTVGFNAFGLSQLNEVQKVFYLKENYDEKYTIKSKEIIIDATKEHDTVTLRSADIYLKKAKLLCAGDIQLITNKAQQYVEVNGPELGFLKEFGAYVGPGWAFKAPFGGAIKLTPVVTLLDGKFGIGGIARYRNDKNFTEIAYSTANTNRPIVRGEQRLTDTLSIAYGINGYMDEGLFGDRLPGKLLEANYKKSYVVDDLGITFSHRLSAGIIQEFDSNWSTTRFRWMGEANKPLWYYGDDVNQRYAALELSTQGAATVYGTGDTFGIVRVGPRIRTETTHWIQTLGYYYSATHGDTPFMFDKYMYGTNNVYLTEGLKLNKYLSLMWSGSLALNRDAWDDKLLQENKFYVMIGPDDLKFAIGYDTVRQRTVFNCYYAFNTKNTNVEYKKLYIKNPNKLGVSEKEEMKAEKARLEAKAEIKPSFSDRLFNRSTKVDIEPESEEKILLERQRPLSNKNEDLEIIQSKINDKRTLPKTEGIKPSRFKSGAIQLHDESTTPMLTPMMAPMLNPMVNPNL